MTSSNIEIINPGLETTIQDYPGRVGVVRLGYPISGPMDSWSFRIANRLVGNEATAAGLECQFIGPTIRFHDQRVVAVCGANMGATIDDKKIESWTSTLVRPGQRLTLGPARTGVRSYVGISGGITTPSFLGSRSTYALGQVGGIAGAPIKTGQRLPLGSGITDCYSRAFAKARPEFPSNQVWSVDVVPGPNDDWIDQPGQMRFLESDWVVSAQSNRVGLRLEGPDWTFARKAYEKSPENGSHPSNIIEHGYGLGSINLCGQTPIILGPDGLTLGGFINPYTVPTCSLWKIGQARPGDVFRFKAVTVAEAQLARQNLDAICEAPDAIEVR